MAGKRQQAKAGSASVSVSMRLDPKTKYLIDLLAREQKRTITGVIEWAIERSADQTAFENTGFSNGPSFLDMIQSLWSTDEALRIVRLALAKPSLLDYDELRVWETIKATQGFWKIIVQSSVSPPTEEHLNVNALQKHWDNLVEHVRKHQNSRSVVPYTLPDEDKAPIYPKSPDLEDFDDEIPF